jgi:ligand-binding SRPBCC domain-containing protein
MAIITQSTIVEGTTKELFQVFLNPQQLLKLPSKVPSLSVHGPEADREHGSILESKIHYGLFSLSIHSAIQEFRPQEFIKSTQIEGPFDSWTHTQTFQMSGDHVAVEDVIEYTTASDSLEDIMQKLVVHYPTLAAAEQVQRERKTEKFRAIRKNVG